jgi:tetratricopeptide (TPR) repeat protein
VFGAIKRRRTAKQEQEAAEWQTKNRELVALIQGRKVTEAVALAEQLVEYVDRKYRKDAREKATAHNNLGMALMLNHDYSLAEECFRSALEMRRRLFGDSHNEVALILLNMARLYQMQANEIMMENRVETTADA